MTNQTEQQERAGEPARLQANMTPEVMRMIDEVIPFRLRLLRNGSLISLSVLHRCLNEIAQEFGAPDGSMCRPAITPDDIAKSAALLAADKAGGDVVASSACPICGKDTPHAHSPEQIAEWLRNQARRFLGNEADHFIRINTPANEIDALRRRIKELEHKVEDLRPETSYENYGKSDAELIALANRSQPNPPRVPDDVVKDAVLNSLDDLGDEAAVHIYPDDLEKCDQCECVVSVYSVRMGSPSGKTVPLFSRQQVSAAIDAAMLKEGKS